MSDLDRYIQKTTMADVRKYASTGTRMGLPTQGLGDIKPQIDVGDYVEGLLIHGQMSVIYGPPNVGKSFFALDLALKVASGEPCHGRDVEQGAVLYIALEGNPSNRIEAYKQQNDISDDIPFRVVTSNIDLKDEASALDIIDTCHQIQLDTSFPVAHIVIDTLSRALCGDDNSPLDMGALIHNVDTIRRETGAHVMLVHHSGKDQARGSRGHSSLPAAIDTEIQVSRSEDGTIVARVQQQRDLPCEGEIAFALESITLGTDRRGNPVTSCVVRSAAAPRQGKRKARLSDMQVAFLDGLHDAIARQGFEAQPEPDMQPVQCVTRKALRDHLAFRGFYAEESTGKQISTRTNDYLNKLRGKGILGLTADLVWIAQPAESGKALSKIGNGFPDVPEESGESLPL